MNKRVLDESTNYLHMMAIENMKGPIFIENKPKGPN